MARNAEIDARELRALDLRLSGASYRQIEGQLGVSRVQAFRDVRRVLRTVVAELALELRNQELARLEKLMQAHWPGAIEGDYRATTVVLTASVVGGISAGTTSKEALAGRGSDHDEPEG